jgi:TnpA family transposase
LVFALATLFGFDLMPRIRNFKDLIFFRASEKIAYPHIDQLFGESGRNVIDWKLIERHWTDLMQVAISISEGRLSSATLMRRLRSNSRKSASPRRPTRSSPTTDSPSGSGSAGCWPTTTPKSRRN